MVLTPAIFGKVSVYPLADESLGVRSMALGVETPDTTILLDAGVSLAPKRYRLPPHPEEFSAARDARRRILEFAKSCEVVTISHFHLDHYTPSYISYYEWANPEVFEATYAGKTVVVKRPDNTVSYNQRRRAAVVLGQLGQLGCKVMEAENANITIGSTRVTALGPFPHGSGEFMGCVMVFCIENGDQKLVYAPDVQGPVDRRTTEILASLKPTLLVIGGPPTYLEGYRVEQVSVEAGLENLATLAKVTSVVISHHMLRELNWREKLEKVGIINFHTYAGIAGLSEKCLEARRRQLYVEKPPSTRFREWLEKYQSGLREPPPI
ncbi:MAG: MBL fold metallo-hydrolase [Thermofilaceae archaeon]